MTRLMAIVNVTPDSFYDGGHYLNPRQAVERCRVCIEEGADILDLGAESTRPGAQPVGSTQQLDRLLPVVRAVKEFSDIPISVDTSDAQVMDECLKQGASIINDVCALENPDCLTTIARHDCTVCLMHKRGTPADMQENPHYADVVQEVRDYFRARVQACQAQDIASERIWLDPGFGFGKSVAHNYTLLRQLAQLRVESRPIVVGLSRKSMIGAVLDPPENTDPRFRLEGSLILACHAVACGADVVRIHDVAATRRALKISQLLQPEGSEA